MKQQTGFKYRIYPSPEQENLFRKTVGCCRLVYNLCVEQRTLVYSMPSRHRISRIDQINELPGLKAYLPFLRDVPGHCLQQVVYDVEKAFRNFFEHRADYPKPRRKFQSESFRFPDPLQIALRDGEIKLPKAGWTRMVLHRPVVGKIKNATVSRSGDHWYVSIQTEQEVDEPVARVLVEAGGDLGVKNALVLSDGTVYDLPQMSEKEKNKKARLNRELSRRKKGSSNRRKTLNGLRRFEASIARRRKDAKHKMTTDVVRRIDVLYLEDLQVRSLTASASGTIEEPGTNVAQKSGLNRAILDVVAGRDPSTARIQDAPIRRIDPLRASGLYLAALLRVRPHRIGQPSHPRRLRMRVMRSHRMRRPQRGAEHPISGPQGPNRRTSGDGL